MNKVVIDFAAFAYKLDKAVFPIICLVATGFASIATARTVDTCTSLRSDVLGHWDSANDFAALHQVERPQRNARMWVDADGDIHASFPAGSLRIGKYVANLLYVNGIPECLITASRVDVVNGNELVLSDLGDARHFKDAPFFVLSIPQLHVRLRVGSGSWK